MRAFDALPFILALDNAVSVRVQSGTNMKSKDEKADERPDIRLQS